MHGAGRVKIRLYFIKYLCLYVLSKFTNLVKNYFLITVNETSLKFFPNYRRHSAKGAAKH